MLAKTWPTAILTRVGIIRPTTHPSRFQDMQKLFDRRDHVPGKKRKKKRGGGEVEEGFGRFGCRAEPTTHAASSFQHHFAASFLPSNVVIDHFGASRCRVSQLAIEPVIQSQQLAIAQSRYIQACQHAKCKVRAWRDNALVRLSSQLIACQEQTQSNASTPAISSPSSLNVK